MRLTSSDKLRTLMGAKMGPDHVYTQKDLAKELGISTRTLRRFKNIKGYRLSKRTEAKIKTPLDAENRRYRRNIQDKVLIPVKTRVRGRVRTDYQLQKIPGMRMPRLPIQPIPILYRAKGGRSHTIRIDCELWSTQQKIDYLISAANSGRFYSWTARVSVKEYLIRKLIEEYGGIENVPIDRLVGLSGEFYMIGPFTLQSFRRGGIHAVHSKIQSEISYHEDAGRIVVSISIVENLPESEWEK